MGLVTLQVKVAKAVHADSKKDEDGDGKGKQYFDGSGGICRG
jgi:hypothetical protein